MEMGTSLRTCISKAGLIAAPIICKDCNSRPIGPRGEVASFQDFLLGLPGGGAGCKTARWLLWYKVASHFEQA